MKNVKIKKINLQLCNDLYKYLLKNNLKLRLGKIVNAYSLGLLCNNLIDGVGDLLGQSQVVNKVLNIGIAKPCASFIIPIPNHFLQNGRVAYASS